MTELPDGVVTFLFTDIEGSTRLWENAPDLMMSALDSTTRQSIKQSTHTTGSR